MLLALEVAVDADDVGVSEAGKRLGFLDEAIEPPAVVVWRSPASGGAASDAAVRGREIRREVFLDGDVAIEGHLVREIGDAEAARAEHAVDAVIPD